MLTVIALAAVLAVPQRLAAAHDTSPALPRASPPPTSVLLARTELDSAIAADTGRRRRPMAIEYSDWYSRRLTVHRWASYTLLPLFAVQYVAGEQIFQKGYAAPYWARRIHRPLASGVAALFTVNTVTGVWNLWDSRSDPSGAGPRIAHSLLMLASDAGFTTAGLLAKPGLNNGDIRRMHRTIAISSMAVALVGYAIMLPPFRRD